MSERTERVALAPRVSREDIMGVAYDRNWIILAYGEETSDVTTEDEFRDQDDTVRIRAVEDDLIKLRYLVAAGDDGAVGAVVSAARDKLETVSPSAAADLYSAADSTPDRVSALYQLGVASDGEPTKGAVKTFERAADDDDDDVRHAAIVAMAYAGPSAQLTAILKAMANGDEAESVRRDATTLLESFQS